MLTAPVEAESEEHRSEIYYFSDVPLFEKRPIEQLREDAEKGDAKQQSLLAYAYRHGPGGRDLAESARWYRKAADQGNAYAQNTLGLIYDRGEGTSQDYVEAAKWYRKAADQGYAPAQFNLGVMYDKGEGVAQDYVEAIKWYRKAADKGFEPAYFNLGVKYDNGQGVAQNFTEAVRWYRKAAYQGWDAAHFNLGHAYANGRGIPKDYALAHMYYNFSISHGSREDQERRAKARDDVAQKLTPQQLADAQQMGTEWQAVNWYRRSAESGDALAQFKLGVSVLQGPRRAAGLRGRCEVVPQSG